MAKPSVVSLFTGGMGLDLGFKRHGFEIKVALDNDKAVEPTIRANNLRIPVIDRNIYEVASSEILELAGLGVGQATVVTGAPPCEPFTTVGARNGFRDRRANAVYSFIRVVNDVRPAYFVFEEVPGFLRAAKRHMSFYKRSRMSRKDLDPDLRLGSAFDEVMDQFRATGYSLSFSPTHPRASLLNAADYGVPQKRIRFVLIGSRDGPPVSLPQTTHAAADSADVHIGAKAPWITLRHALADIDYDGDENADFPKTWGKYVHMVPPGGCWRALPEHLHPVVLGGAYDDGSDPLKAGKMGGRTGYLRRLAWDRPAPTLVDRPTHKANCLGHPDEPRPLSIKEYARIQGFDDNWKFEGSLCQRYRLIGQATPVLLATAIAARILEHQMETRSENGNREIPRNLHPLQIEESIPQVISTSA